MGMVLGPVTRVLRRRESDEIRRQRIVSQSQMWSHCARPSPAIQRRLRRVGTGKDAVIVRDKVQGNRLSMVYEVRKPFIYNIDFVVKFSHSEPLGSKSTGD